MKTRFAALCAVGFLVGSGVAFAGDSPEVEVSVGYADTLINPPFTPSPWQDSPGVIFIGEDNSGTYDAGAIKLDNPGPGPLIVDNVTVDIGGTTGINPWTSYFPLRIPKKGTAILTQTGGTFSFDTSDIPPVDEGTRDYCHQDGFIPLVHVTVGRGQQETINFVDSTQVLNTGGIDPHACTGTSEGHQWQELDEVDEDRAFRD